MILSSCIEKEIRLWWEPRRKFTEGCRYRITLDGKVRVYTDKIYYNFKNVNTNVTHSFAVEVVDAKGAVVEAPEYYVAEDLCSDFSVINVTESPYGATGDGETDCTSAIARATESGKERACVYFPLGIYRADKITVNGTLKLRFDRGAIVTKGEEE